MSAAPLPLPAAPLGLYAPGDYRLCTGEAAGEALGHGARFLFARETVALPVGGPLAGIARGIDPFADLRAWSAAPGPLTRAPLVWIAATERRTGARPSADGRTVAFDGSTTPFALVPKIPLNRSYADASTFRFLADRTVTMRGGTQADGTFVARSIWPEDWRLDDKAPRAPLEKTPDPALAVRSLVRSAPRGGAESPVATHVIWEREPGHREWAGSAVVGVMVNGAQGDDDEAWGGHFALVTGRLPADGRLSDLLVANFYTLEVESEKGILAAPVPLDNYLADLNSGQAWYRPSYLVLAMLESARAAELLQGGLNRLYLQFWRRQLEYRHSTMNCASISVDAMRALGWAVPSRGPAGVALAWLSVPAMIFREGKVSVARTSFEYLTEDRTRLLPAAAFEEAVADLLRLAREGTRESDGALSKMLAQDVVAIAGVRVPQIPSSRKFGTWAVATTEEYTSALPHDPADAQVVPVPPRIFPASLREPDLPPPATRRSTLPLLVWGATGVLLLAWLAGWVWRLLRR